MNYAPGWPGIKPKWTSASKSGVGTALSGLSRVWFTLSHGIVNEVYYPRIDQACTRDMGFVVTDGKGLFSEEKRECEHAVELVEHGVPAFRLTNTCAAHGYRLTKTIFADPQRDVLLQRVKLEALNGQTGLRLFVILAPHLVNRGAANTAWLDTYKGMPMLFASGAGSALALASSVPWRAQSASFVGPSDSWSDLSRDKRMTNCYERAENGNTALTGEIDLSAAKDGEFLLALGFGRTDAEAALHTRTALFDDVESSQRKYIEIWRDWQDRLRMLDDPTQSPVHNAYRMSTMVLRCHEESAFGGGMIASLAIPWGFAHGDDDLGGYHLVWPRDLVETAGALLAADAFEDAVRVLSYLESTQEEDGHWPQNMWLDGTSYWGGLQMDECAFPILLADLARRCGALSPEEAQRFWPMIERACRYIVLNGPVTGQDRWEEDGGFSPFTLAVEISALLAAADFADMQSPEMAAFLQETADDWNDRIEHWTYAQDGALGKELGLDGYYVRISPPGGGCSLTGGMVQIRNRPTSEPEKAADMIVSPDALALVRFGLRAADDPRIVNTVKLIDHMLKVKLPAGPSWHRYNGDGYGEHADGAPFDGTGIGRAWPLLTGERAHYELALGNIAEAERLLGTLESFCSSGSMIPEQVWDSPDIPEHELFFGKPSGSAMPLVWAHAEHIKLRRSIADGRIFDLPPQPYRRYQIEKVTSRLHGWRVCNKCREVPEGRDLRVELTGPGLVHWSLDNWKTQKDSETRDSGLGLHICDLPAAGLKAGAKIVFTFRNNDSGEWCGENYTLDIV